jgi:hypothetical protein
MRVGSLSALVVWLFGAAWSPAALAQSSTSQPPEPYEPLETPPTPAAPTLPPGSLDARPGPPRVDGPPPGQAVAPTAIETTAPAPLTWYGWQSLLVDVAAGALVIGTNGDKSSVELGLVLFAAGGPTIHLLHRERGKAALSFVLRTLVPLGLLLAITSPNTDGGGDIPGVVPALAGMLGASIVDAAVLGWSGTGQRRGHFYGRVGLLNAFSTDVRGAAAVGFGYRHELGSLALDISGFNICWGSGLGRTSNGSSVLWSSYGKVLGLGYLDRFVGKDMYVGGGVSYGEIALRNPDPFGVGTSGRGPQTELVAGIELLRRASVRTFIELDTTLPLYRVRQVMGATAISEYAFTTTLSVGFGV